MILLDYITVKHYADQIKKSTAWVYELIKNDKLKPPAVEIDGVKFVNKNAKVK